MHKLIYLISIIAITLGLSGFTFPLWLELTTALTLIGIVGLSHGAIDHILAVRALKIVRPNQTIHFIGFYVLLIGIYFCMWLISPLLSFIFFLLYSAFHFGQADVDTITNKMPSWLSSWLAVSWGLIIIGGLIFFNSSEIVQITPDWVLSKLKLPAVIKWSLPVLAASSLSLLTAFYALGYNAHSRIQRRFINKLFQLVLILLVFASVPLITGFSIYFGLWHALPVLQKEYELMQTKQITDSLIGFIKLLLPFTFISLGFMIFLIVISKQNVFYNTLIAISTLALPHTLLMHLIYKKESTISKRKMVQKV